MIKSMFHIKASQFTLNLFPAHNDHFITVLLFASLLFLIHFCEEVFAWKNPLFSENIAVRWASYILLGLITISFGTFTSSQFIYFQF